MIAGALCTKHGALDPADVYTYPSGFAKCRICGREHEAARRERKRVEVGRRLGRVRNDAVRVFTLYHRTRLEVGEIVTMRHKTGRLLWQHWGFRSAEEATDTLRDAWNEDTLLDHDLGAPSTRARGLCASCGVGVGERTRGCKICADRHRHRRLRGYAYVDVDGTRKAA